MGENDYVPDTTCGIWGSLKESTVTAAFLRL